MSSLVTRVSIASSQEETLWSCLEGHGNLEVNVSSLLMLQYSCHEIFQKDSPGEMRTSLFRSFSGGKST